jgi:hypothetical protein
MTASLLRAINDELQPASASGRGFLFHHEAVIHSQRFLFRIAAVSAATLDLFDKGL